MNRQELIEEASRVYLKNFRPVTYFERAIFFSWYCSIGDCTYCYMSTNPEKHKRNIARRTTESILAETLLCKKLGWEIGFVSGGMNAYSKIEFRNLMGKIYNIYGEKTWINIGPLGKKALEAYLPYSKGVVGAVETVNPELHKKVCPSKPVEPITKMFEYAEELKLKKAMTIIVGLGETMKDYDLLKEFIEQNSIDKIHFYSLIPHKDTMFENAKVVEQEYQAEWIARTRIDFPKIGIQAGIWVDRVQNISLLLKSGANSISKFPSIRLFNSGQARIIEQQAKRAGREFLGTMTELPDMDITREIDKLNFDDDMKKKIEKKLLLYLKTLKKTKSLNKITAKISNIISKITIGGG